MNDKVAIITPSFNRGYIIGETAESVFAQSHENWEWIIVDDGSTDDSWDLIQSYAKRDSRVKAIQRDRGPKGACTCRNIAIAHSDANWLIFLDTDDLLHPECLKQRLSAAQCAEESEVRFFPTLVFEKNTEQCWLWDDPHLPTEWLEGVLTMRPPAPGSGTIWPRKLWDSRGGWREDLTVWQDIELHSRAHWNGVQFHPAQGAFPDFFIRSSPDSLSRVGFHSKGKLDSRMIIIEECWKSWKQHPSNPSERQALATMTLNAIKNGGHLGLFSEMISWLQLPHLDLTSQELSLARLMLATRRWKLDRIPLVKKHIQRKWNATCPESPRKLGAHPWPQP